MRMKKEFLTSNSDTTTVACYNNALPVSIPTPSTAALVMDSHWNLKPCLCHICCWGLLQTMVQIQEHLYVCSSFRPEKKKKKKSCCYGMGRCQLFCPSLWAIIKVFKSLHMWSLHVVTYSGCSWKHASMACILALLLEPPAIRSSYRGCNDVMTDVIIESPPLCTAPTSMLPT